MSMTSSQSETKFSAVILDLDGTLLDTESATKWVLKEFLTKYGKELDKEREDRERLGTTIQVSAEAIVKDYHLPLTPQQFIREIMPMYQDKWSQAKALPGANRLIKHLYKNGVPFALASNSLREYIDTKISHQQGWNEFFSVILGSDEVQSGKPSPDIFIEAARRMGVEAAECLVIEDSLVGVKAAKAAKMKVVAVPPRSEADCSLLADGVLHSLLEFQPELWGLPPFDDWVDNALPLEPISMTSPYKNGHICELTNDGKFALPHQISGRFFGWAKVDICRIFKVVVSIGWNCCSLTAKRNLQLCIIDGNVDEISDQQMQIVLVGYIRGSNSMGITSMDVKIREEDISNARASLDLPLFTHNFLVPLSQNLCTSEGLDCF